MLYTAAEFTTLLRAGNPIVIRQHLHDPAFMEDLIRMGKLTVCMLNLRARLADEVGSCHCSQPHRVHVRRDRRRCAVATPFLPARLLQQIHRTAPGNLQQQVRRLRRDPSGRLKRHRRGDRATTRRGETHPEEFFARRRSLRHPSEPRVRRDSGDHRIRHDRKCWRSAEPVFGHLADGLRSKS